MLEHHHQPLAPRRVFISRLLRSLQLAAAIVAISLGIGVLGYHFLANLSWIDALLNASMILTGMGPVDLLHTVAAKLFASFYALFSGIVFISTAGIILAPAVHRFLHRFHAEMGMGPSEGAATRKAAPSDKKKQKA